jgi:hypothetical protein
MAARKEPTGWVQDIAPPRSSFLRRKVASRHFTGNRTYRALGDSSPSTRHPRAIAQFHKIAIVRLWFVR